MAVVNRWGSSLVEAGKKDDAAKVAGGKLMCVAAQVEVAEADSDGSIYKLAKLPANAIPVKCDIFNDAIAGATSYDLGLYNEDETTEADKDVFMAATDINAGSAIGSPRNGLATGPAIADIGKRIWELAGDTVNTKEGGYVLALTGNTVGTAAGTISVFFYYLVG